MTLHVLAYTLVALFSGAAAFTLTRQSRVCGLTVAAVSAVLLVATAFFLGDHPAWIFVLPITELWLWSNPALPAATAIAGVVLALPAKPAHRAVLILPILALGTFRAFEPILLPAPTLGPDRWSGPVCRQSTLATCGPAAIASALRAVGIPATEATLTPLALTNSSGTSDLGLYRALRIASANSNVKISLHNGPLSTLNTFPAVVPIKMTSATTTLFPIGAKHAITLLARTPDGQYLVADPFSGQQLLPESHLTPLYQHTALTITPK